MWALVPLKSPATAKSRLREILVPAKRRELLLLVARHVIDTLSRTPQISNVVVICANDEVAGFAETCGASVVRQDVDRGTASAFTMAVKHLRPLRLPSVLMIAGDLPCLDVQSVEDLLAAGQAAPSVAIAPDRRETGTNALVCTPPDVILPSFGEDSFRRHCEAARSAGAMLNVVRSAQLGLDIDLADDLDQAQRYLEITAGSDRRMAGSLQRLSAMRSL